MWLWVAVCGFSRTPHTHASRSTCSLYQSITRYPYPQQGRYTDSQVCFTMFRVSFTSFTHPVSRVSHMFRACFACFARVSRVSRMFRGFACVVRGFAACFADSRHVSFRGFAFMFRTHCFAVSRIFHASFTHLSCIFHKITHYLRVVNPCNVPAADRVLGARGTARAGRGAAAFARLCS